MNDNKPSIPDMTDDQIRAGFERTIAAFIGSHFKKGLMWKSKLRWTLLKEWNNSPLFNMGYAREVRKRYGDDEALSMFRAISDEIMNDPARLEKAILDERESFKFR